MQYCAEYSTQCLQAPGWEECDDDGCWLEHCTVRRWSGYVKESGFSVLCREFRSARVARGTDKTPAQNACGSPMQGCILCLFLRNVVIVYQANGFPAQQDTRGADRNDTVAFRRLRKPSRSAAALARQMCSWSGGKSKRSVAHSKRDFLCCLCDNHMSVTSQSDAS